MGRLHDFLEDAKLYAEPVIFSLLPLIFPTIRMWTQETTSLVIEWLHELNSFFGLQGESEYYQPLVERVFQILDNESIIKGSRPSVVITGHSLGNFINDNDNIICFEIEIYSILI